MEGRITKREVLDRIRAERALLDEAVAQLGEEQMTRRGVQDGWSVKDILAHIVAWERRLIDWLQAAARGTIPAVAVPRTAEDVDRLNAESFRRDQQRPATDVVQEYRRSVREVLKAVEELADEASLHVSLPREWANEAALWQVIAANTYEHYQEHIEPIRHWHESNRSK